jgi:type IV pilus assembly protein PilV
MNIHFNCLKKNAGFGLIEVLIAVLVLALALLGLAALQVTSLKNNQSAYNRSQATQLAYDLADRMRANIKGKSTYTSMLPSAAKVKTDCRKTIGCSFTDMAENDLYEWNCSVAIASGCKNNIPSIEATLPNGQGVVCLDASPDDGASATDPQCTGTGTVFVVKIWWDDDRTKDPVTVLRFVTSFELPV